MGHYEIWEMNGKASRVWVDSAPHGKPAPPKRKRARATVIAEQKGRVLLVRERGSRSFSLPGGGIDRGESTVEAALRELREETQLAPVKAERLFDHEGATQMHKVVWVLTKGKVRLQRREVSEYLWWDGKEQVTMLPSAKDIISKHRKTRR